jgi:hypothetical protein
MKSCSVVAALVRLPTSHAITGRRRTENIGHAFRIFAGHVTKT